MATESHRQLTERDDVLFRSISAAFMRRQTTASFNTIHTSTQFTTEDKAVY